MKLFRNIAFFLVCIISLPVCSQQYKLWYREPARVWTDALPLGNGRLGAMVYGIPSVERLQLNEETIWTGQPNNNPNQNAKAAIPVIQKLLFEGKYKEAQDLASDKVMSATNNGMAYQNFGNVYISTPNISQYTNYKRELSLDSAIAATTYTVDGVNYRREVITSFSDNVITVKFTASKPGMITFNVNFTSPHDDVIITSDNNESVLQGVSSKLEDTKGKVRFMGRMAAITKTGEKSTKATSQDRIISVKNADEAVLYISIATNFVNYQNITGDESAKSENYLKNYCCPIKTN